MSPKISVVIPTYNRVGQVQKAIESVLGQTVSDLEVIVVDDGSSDGTGQMLRKVYGDRIRYYYQANQGASAARNKGISEARGEWIAFLDSDDFWENEKLEWQLKALEQFGPNCGACYTDVRLFNHPETRTLFEMGEKGYQHDTTMGVNREVPRLLVRSPGAGMLVFIGSVLARTDAVRKIGGCDPNLPFGEDSDFLFRLAMLTEFCYVNRPLVWFDRSPGEVRHVGVTADWNRLEFVLECAQLRFEKFLRISVGYSGSLQSIIREQLGSVYSGLANCYLETGRYDEARRAISRAARFDLTFNVAMKWVLTWLSPRLALRAVQRHLETKQNPFPIL